MLAGFESVVRDIVHHSQRLLSGLGAAEGAAPPPLGPDAHRELLEALREPDIFIKSPQHVQVGVGVAS